ncbi:hypothetical protein ACUR5C_09390 [Aliikangiella sp. IMCC44653]
MKMKLKVFLVTICFVLSLGACADTKQTSTIDLNDYLGDYHVTKVERYRGGLTTDQEALERVGKCSVINKELFKAEGVELQKPVYKIVEHIIKTEEGNVVSKNQRAFLSIYNGFKTERKKVVSLNVYSPDDLKDYEDSFEIIGADELLNLYDGFFYFYKKGCKVTN